MSEIIVPCILNPRHPHDLTGMTFGRLKVLRFMGRGKRNRQVWECECSCGAIVGVDRTLLLSGNTKSCGCLKVDRMTRHGMSRTLTYQTWEAMKTRCYYSKSNPGYKNYGGRGIRVCKRWLDFVNFLADMGERPTPKHTLERIDIEKGYEPGNVRWATTMEQGANRRNNNRVTFEGKTLHLSEWSRRLGIPYTTLRARLEKAPPEVAFTMPLHPGQTHEEAIRNPKPKD